MNQSVVPATGVPCQLRFLRLAAFISVLIIANEPRRRQIADVERDCR
jgi:hypothetical protein